MTAFGPADVLEPVAPAVAVYGLRVSYGGGVEAPVEALRGVGVTVGASESVAVLGPSGSGKSSLLGVVAGLSRPSGGEVLVFGRPVERSLGEVGVVLQSPGRNLFAGASAVENVVVVQRARGVSGRVARVRAGELLERVGLAGVGGRRVRELSGGEQQRLAVAVALALRPRLLVADEPTSQLDGASGRVVAGLLQEAHRVEGMALLVVTHDEAVAGLFDRTIRLRDGLLDTADDETSGSARLRERITVGASEEEAARARGVTAAESGEVAPAVAVYGLRVSYGGGVEAPVEALRGVGVTVGASESVAVLGPSGSGKSSLLGVVAGLSRPSGGEVLVFGRPVERSLGEVGVVLQSPGRNLFAGASAVENVVVVQRARGVSGRVARVRAGELLERVGLAGVGGRRVRELSGGEQQRLAVAVALALRPRLLVADEPTSQLDGASGRVVAGLLQEAHRVEGMALLVVTHDEAVAGLFDRTIRLRDGLLDTTPMAA